MERKVKVIMIILSCLFLGKILTTKVEGLSIMDEYMETERVEIYGKNGKVYEIEDFLRICIRPNKVVFIDGDRTTKDIDLEVEKVEIYGKNGKVFGVRDFHDIVIAQKGIWIDSLKEETKETKNLNPDVYPAAAKVAATSPRATPKDLKKKDVPKETLKKPSAQKTAGFWSARVGQIILYIVLFPVGLLIVILGVVFWPVTLGIAIWVTIVQGSSGPHLGFGGHILGVVAATIAVLVIIGGGAGAGAGAGIIGAILASPYHLIKMLADRIKRS